MRIEARARVATAITLVVSAICTVATFFLVPAPLGIRIVATALMALGQLPVIAFAYFFWLNILKGWEQDRS